jgi:hypothetical protein
MGTDKKIPRHAYTKHFTVRFLDTNEWEGGFQPDRNRGLLFFTDSSKTDKAIRV